MGEAVDDISRNVFTNSNRTGCLHHKIDYVLMESIVETTPSHSMEIPMRDGVQLHAEIYMPPDTEGPLPVLLHLTPCDERVPFTHTASVFFSTNNYIVAKVSCRGCGQSGGEWELFAGNGPDGFDAVEWLAQQSWCDQQVAMWGGSYCGFTQWATAAEFPPHLRAIAPAAACGIVRDFPMVNNIPMSFLAFFYNFVDRKATEPASFDGQPFSWREVYYKRYMENLPFASLDSLAGCPSDQFQETIRHPMLDSHWNSLLPNQSDYERLDLPILSITSHYDGDQRGAMMYYNNHQEFGTKKALDQHYLVFGPWNHSGSCVQPKQQLAGLDFGESSVFNMLGFNLRWFDWILKGREKPEFLKNRVVYFLESDNCWKSVDNLCVATSRTKLYLDSQDAEASLAQPGLLSVDIPSQAVSTDFVYDPLDTSPGKFERENETIYHSDGSHVEKFLVDQTAVLERTLQREGLVFESEPFDRATEITGYMRLVVWISMNVPDTDFQVAIYENTTDQQSIILTDDMMRARHRVSPEKESLVVPGEINRFEFNRFQLFSRKIREGSRIRLVFRCINSIYWQKNYNSVTVVARETAKDSRTARITVHQGKNYASFAEFPIVE